MARTPPSTRGTLLLGGLACVLAVFAACTSGENQKKDQALPTIAPIEGMKYYVGGPVMKHDKYNRLRLGGFSGEVGAPTSRGLLIGYKLDPDGKRFDYRTWLNGRPVSKSTGFLDSDGLLWFTERETLDSNGRVIAKQTFQYDDANKVMHTTIQQMDPDSGQTIATHAQDMPYTPPEEPDEDEDEEDEEEEGTGGSTE